MENLTKEYTDEQTLPGKGNSTFVVTLKNAWFDNTILEPCQTQMHGEVESVAEFADVGYWEPYDYKNVEAKRGIVPKKYLVCRKDGNIHFEKFNGTGWAYNDKTIVFYSDIVSPLHT